MVGYLQNPEKTRTAEIGNMSANSALDPFLVALCVSPKRFCHSRNVPRP